MEKYKRNTDANESRWPERLKKKEKKSNLIKRAKVAGKQHVNHMGKVVNPRQVGVDCRCKRLRCFQKISEAERDIVFKRFNNMTDKNEQDSYLCSLISIRTISRRRPRDPNRTTKTHAASFSYKIRVGGKEDEVCLQALLSIHSITIPRIRRLQESLMVYGKSPRDKRGIHSNRPKQFPEELLNLIKIHIKSFQPMQSHYSFRNNPNCVYLPEGLSIKIMHSLFVQEYKVNIPYKVYWQTFKKSFNIKFGLPRSDTCAECDAFRQNMTSTTISDEEKAQLSVAAELHHRKAEAFHQLKRQYKIRAKANELTCISFDFMQNLPLPHIPSNPVFFSRQLWHYVFGVHNLGTEEVSMYTYNEGQYKKGACDVTSMLFHFLKNCDTNRKLVLLSDGCPGQNKNYVMMHFLFIIVHCLKMFDLITYIFPVRGHSYLPNDQDFALIERKKRKQALVELPEEWNSLIESARKHPLPFKVVNLNAGQMFDVKQSIDKYFLKNPKPKVEIKKVRVINVDKRFPDVRVKDSYNGTWRHCLIRNKVSLPRELAFLPLYTEPNKISDVKIENLRLLLPLLSHVNKLPFYHALIEDQKSIGGHGEDNEDNSSGCDD